MTLLSSTEFREMHFFKLRNLAFTRYPKIFHEIPSALQNDSAFI